MTTVLDSITETHGFVPDTLLIAWIQMHPGAFHVRDLTDTKDRQQLFIDKLEGLVNGGYLDRYGDKRGWYIPRQNDLVEMDWKNAERNPVKVWMPFNLENVAEVYPGNVIVVAGAPNSGKTAFLFNVIAENDSAWKVHYFSSEMGDTELRKRLEKFEYRSLDMWKFKAYERSGRFADVIQPGPDNLNIIDFLEVHDEFYLVAKRLKEIHDRLDGGVAIVALQANPGQDTALGGFRSLEVARLAIKLDHGRLKIVKAKNICDSFLEKHGNPNGLCRDFKLAQGWRFAPDHSWYREV